MPLEADPLRRTGVTGRAARVSRALPRRTQSPGKGQSPPLSPGGGPHDRPGAMPRTPRGTPEVLPPGGRMSFLTTRGSAWSACSPTSHGVRDSADRATSRLMRSPGERWALVATSCTSRNTCGSRIRCQAAMGNWTSPRQWVLAPFAVDRGRGRNHGVRRAATLER